jgi:hypothetical protein
LFPVFHKSFSLIGSLFKQQTPCSPRDLLPCQELHALAAFEQGDWLTELDLLHLGDALHRSALSQSGYDDTTFDVMVGIADLLESEHGWSTEQSEAWLDRMGLWDEDFWAVGPTKG